MKFHRFLASGFGSGYLRPAPGTWGSLVGILPAFFLPPVSFVAFLILLFLAGVWASEKVSQETGSKDPQTVVIDEVVGMGVTLLFLPKTLLFYIAGFAFFRFFDVTKPWIIRKLEVMHGGWGIMLDDLAAGIAANILLQILAIGLVLFKISQ